MNRLTLHIYCTLCIKNNTQSRVQIDPTSHRPRPVTYCSVRTSYISPESSSGKSIFLSSPDFENTRSLGTDVAIMAKYFFARVCKFGNFCPCSCQKYNGKDILLTFGWERYIFTSEMISMLLFFCCLTCERERDRHTERDRYWDQWSIFFEGTHSKRHWQPQSPMCLFVCF